MIQIDDRIGSAEMAPLLRQLGVEVELTRMAFGDVAFMGWAQNGTPVSVGLELKKLDDVIACIESGRFAGHQLPGLIQSYDHIWLLVCGSWYGRRADGVLLTKRINHRGQEYWVEAGGGRRRWMARDLESWLISMEILGGIRVHRVEDWQEGAQWIKTVANWFSRDDHKSHKVLFQGKHLYPDQALLAKPTLARRIAAELPLVAEKRSADVARTFHSPTIAEYLHRIADADPKEWRRVPGIGPGIAKRIHHALHATNGNGK